MEYSQQGARPEPYYCADNASCNFIFKIILIVIFKNHNCFFKIIISFKIIILKLDEAEVLSDRIGIMARGKLLTVGTNEFIKKRFGIGYRLKLTLF
jgi:hypothetical protein